MSDLIRGTGRFLQGHIWDANSSPDNPRVLHLAGLIGEECKCSRIAWGCQYHRPNPLMERRGNLAPRTGVWQSLRNLEILKFVKWCAAVNLLERSLYALFFFFFFLSFYCQFVLPPFFLNWYCKKFSGECVVLIDLIEPQKTKNRMGGKHWKKKKKKKEKENSKLG